MEETKDAKVFLVVNKIDLIPGFETTDNKEEVVKNMSYYDNLIDFADSRRLQTFFVSAKLEKGIKDMFN